MLPVEDWEKAGPTQPNTIERKTIRKTRDVFMIGPSRPESSCQIRSSSYTWVEYQTVALFSATQTDTAQDVLKARIPAKIFPSLFFQKSHFRVAMLITFFQPGQGLVRLTECVVNERDVIGRNPTRLRKPQHFVKDRTRFIEL